MFDPPRDIPTSELKPITDPEEAFRFAVCTVPENVGLAVNATLPVPLTPFSPNTPELLNSMSPGVPLEIVVVPTVRPLLPPGAAHVPSARRKFVVPPPLRGARPAAVDVKDGKLVKSNEIGAITLPLGCQTGRKVCPLVVGLAMNAVVFAAI